MTRKVFLNRLYLTEFTSRYCAQTDNTRRAPSGRNRAGYLLGRRFGQQKREPLASLTLVGGFHSPVEQEVLRVTLKGSAGVVFCLARGLEGARLSPELKSALEDGRLLLLSPFGAGVRRVDSQKAERRNRLVVGLASRVLIIHAAQGGATERLVEEAKARGKQFEGLENLQQLK